MAKCKSGNKKTKIPSTVTQVSHGTEWLCQLNEPQFRDDILKELFSQMKSKGDIVDFLYTHGRNEHGIDWLVMERGGLSNRYVGIQAKSRLITMQGDSKSESALSVKMQCECAYSHRFIWAGNEIRVDNVELWMSSHITADAVQEFMAPLSQHKIGVKQVDQVFTLISKHCPKLISEIPSLVEASYLKRMAHPEPLPIRIFGIQLNPEKHFMEPKLSRDSPYSPNRVFSRRKNKEHKPNIEPPLDVRAIIVAPADYYIVGAELSGKSYLLKRLACLFAQNETVPLCIDAQSIKALNCDDVCRILAEQLVWLSGDSLKAQGNLARTIVVLIDNADDLSDDEIAAIRKSAHSNIKFVLVGRKTRALKGFVELFLEGVSQRSVQNFVRSLDAEANTKIALTDRATQFVLRTLGTSGLPTNPFTVSVMLQECNVAKNKLATPTMGRLIERFVQSQIGSHSETMRVDYETKLDFLTCIGGSRIDFFSAESLRRKLARYLAKHGHAHTLADFEADLLESGLLELDHATTRICWAHSIFCDYFWVRNMVRERKEPTLAKVLLKKGSRSVAAICGSQLGNAHKVLAVVLKELDGKIWMKETRPSTSKNSALDLEFALPSDADEEHILQIIEDDANGKDNTGERATENESALKDELEKGLSSEISKSIVHFADKITSDKLQVAGLVSALLLNARALSLNDKETAAICILRSNAQTCRHVGELLSSWSKGKISQLLVDVYSLYMCMIMSDALLGDAFLHEIFKGLLRRCKNSQERLVLTDILVACGCRPSAAYLSVIPKSNNRLADSIAVYFRLVSTYYFRFHKQEEKDALKETMKAVRKLAKGFQLPTVD